MESLIFWRMSTRALLLGLFLAMSGQALAQRAAPKPSLREDAYQAAVQTAALLYEDLEYEKALETLAKAKSLAKTDNERVEVALYEGVVLADLGQRPQALAAFREALSLQLETQLPVKVSPKVARDFETVRAEVRFEREAQARAKASSKEPPAATTDSPTLPREPVAVPFPTTLAPAPGVNLNEPSLNEERTRRLRPLPVILLGAGVVAGGAGSYFGLRSKGNIQDARDSNLVEDQAAHLEEARGQALAANILFGVAVTAAAGAVITWFTGNETASTEEVSP